MAHPCALCGEECYCCGDIDDCIVSKTPARCKGCDGCQDELRDQEQDAWEPEGDWEEEENETQ